MLVWDETKRAANIAKHGLDFAAMREFDWDSAGHVETQIVDHDRREVMVGLIAGRPCVVVYSEREGSVRVISLRRANRSEIGRWQRM